MKKTLKDELKNLYTSNRDYHIYARRLNIPISDERKDAFRFIPDGSLVLDVGCGTAENGRFISGFARYVGLDLSKIALDMASDYKTENFHLIRGDVSRFCFKPASFDVVLSTYSLEHFLAPRYILDEMYEVCKKGGNIIILSPAWDLPFQFPPSMGIGFNLRKRFLYTLPRIFEDLTESLFGIKRGFKVIRNPSFITDGYSQDNDTVYLMKAGEVIAYLKDRGCKVVYLSAARELNSRNAITKFLKRILIKLPIYRFGASSLFAVLQK